MEKKKTSEAQIRAVNKYNAKNTKTVLLRLNLETDKDIIDELDRQESKNGYLKELVRADIKEREQIGLHVIVKKHDGVKQFFCPSCNSEIISNGDPIRCKICGQHLNWMEKYL